MACSALKSSVRRVKFTRPVRRFACGSACKKTQDVFFWEKGGSELTSKKIGKPFLLNAWRTLLAAAL
jgi:hypothetical protein